MINHSKMQNVTRNLAVWFHGPQHRPKTYQLNRARINFSHLLESYKRLLRSWQARVEPC